MWSKYTLGCSKHVRWTSAHTYGGRKGAARPTWMIRDESGAEPKETTNTGSLPTNMDTTFTSCQNAVTSRRVALRPGVPCANCVCVCAHTCVWEYVITHLQRDVTQSQSTEKYHLLDVYRISSSDDIRIFIQTDESFEPFPQRHQPVRNTAKVRTQRHSPKIMHYLSYILCLCVCVSLFLHNSDYSLYLRNIRQLHAKGNIFPNPSNYCAAISLRANKEKWSFNNEIGSPMFCVCLDGNYFALNMRTYLAKCTIL